MKTKSIKMLLLSKTENKAIRSSWSFSAIFLVIIFISISSCAIAQKPDTLVSSSKLKKLSLEDLMQIKVFVSTKTGIIAEENPSIVSVITDEDIRNSGARDLIDVLRMVPGMHFGMDVAGMIGLGMRGNWGHEGKILLLIDGQEMNETMYSTLQLGNHFDVNQIKIIEVIRGSGSAIYGGYAELGVINVITFSGEEINGIKAHSILGYSGNQISRSNFGLMAGKKIKDFNFSLHGFYGKSIRSDMEYSDIFGSKIQLGETSALDPASVNAGIKYKGLEIRYIYDLYKTKTADWYEGVLPQPYQQNFTNHLGEIKYEWKIKERFILLPKFNYRLYKPWESINPSVPYTPEDYFANYKRRAERVSGNLTSIISITKKINVLAGTEYYSEKGEDLTDIPMSVFGQTSSKSVKYNNFAGFLQTNLQSRIFNLTAGSRFDIHSHFGQAFSPRISLTSKIKKFHAKLLYNQAFRAPSIENISLNNELEPEITKTLEMEVGHRLTDKMILNLNVFDITINNPIIFFYNPETNFEGYQNFKKNGTRGFEAEYKLRDVWGGLSISYSYYHNAGKNRVPLYEVPEKELLVGFSNHQFNFKGNFNINKKISINPGLYFLGKRYGYDHLDQITGEPSLSEFNPIALIDLFVYFPDFIIKGLNAGVGIYNLTNERFLFIQPYNGGHAPMPGMGREFILKIGYDLNFENK